MHGVAVTCHFFRHSALLRSISALCSRSHFLKYNSDLLRSPSNMFSDFRHTISYLFHPLISSPFICYIHLQFRFQTLFRLRSDTTFRTPSTFPTFIYFLMILLLFRFRNHAASGSTIYYINPCTT